MLNKRACKSALMSIEMQAYKWGIYIYENDSVVCLFLKRINLLRLLIYNFYLAM